MKKDMQYSEARGYNLGIARELGIAPALLYNQLLFWAARSKEDWFFKTYDDLTDELPLSKRTVQSARETLEAAGYVVTAVRKANGTPMLHWSILRIATFNVANSATTEMANSATSNNNKESNKENIGKPTESQDVRKIYRLYLKQFIIPYKLPEKFKDASDFEQYSAAEKRYKLTADRRDAIKRRLEDAGYAMVCAAIVGYSREPWYVGENDRGWFAKLDKFICRSYEKIEEGANKYEAQKQRTNTNDPWA